MILLHAFPLDGSMWGDLAGRRIDYPGHGSLAGWALGYPILMIIKMTAVGGLIPEGWIPWMREINPFWRAVAPVWESGSSRSGEVRAFLGGTIGNFTPGSRRRFLRSIAALLGEGDHLLLGTDLVKDVETLEAAYDDAAGVTAEFNRNVLRVINRELDARFDVDAFDHVAVWDEQEERIEMHLRAQREMEVDVPGAAMRVVFAAGETVRTEISCKFTRESGEAMLAEAAMRVVQWHTDPRGRFALALALPG